MVDRKKVKEKLDWYRENIVIYQDLPFDEYFADPIMEALGDDVNEILAYLDEIDVEDLDWLSGLFDDIYAKWMTDEVWDALEKLEKKIADAKATAAE